MHFSDSPLPTRSPTWVSLLCSPCEDHTLLSSEVDPVSGSSSLPCKCSHPPQLRAVDESLDLGVEQKPLAF